VALVPPGANVVTKNETYLFRWRCMSLELIIGPMYAGKSSYLLSLISKYEAIGWKILTLTSRLDTRYEKDAIHSHNHGRHDAVAVSYLGEADAHPAYADSKLILIEESQFFEDLVAFVLHAVEAEGKHVVVVGLSGDFNRKPFGHTLELIPFCDRITKLTALCRLCGDGTPALFTHRTSKETSVISVGAAGSYDALCRKHYLLA
jgi:thymidine kinase